MIGTYAWADHRIFEAASRADGKALLFGIDHASLFALDRPTRDVLVRWRGRETVDLREATHPEREVLEALRDALVLVCQEQSQGVGPDPGVNSSSECIR